MIIFILSLIIIFILIYFYKYEKFRLQDHINVYCPYGTYAYANGYRCCKHNEDKRGRALYPNGYHLDTCKNNESIFCPIQRYHHKTPNTNLKCKEFPIVWQDLIHLFYYGRKMMIKSFFSDNYGDNSVYKEFKDETYTPNYNDYTTTKNNHDAKMTKFNYYKGNGFINNLFNPYTDRIDSIKKRIGDIKTRQNNNITIVEKINKLNEDLNTISNDANDLETTQISYSEKISEKIGEYASKTNLNNITLDLENLKISKTNTYNKELNILKNHTHPIITKPIKLNHIVINSINENNIKCYKTNNIKTTCPIFK